MIYDCAGLIKSMGVYPKYNKVLYICDGNACENPSCKKADSLCEYTSNIEHALNFERCGDSNIFAEVGKTCEWIHQNDDRNDWFVCSNCGFGDEGELQEIPNYNFCPVCGFRIKKG